MHPAGSGGWDPATNTFTCPLSGYFHFFLSLWKYDDLSSTYNCDASLMKSAGGGEVTVVRVRNNNYNSASVRFSSTAQAIIPCEEGERVWVRMVQSCRLGDNSYHYNQFSGVLLMEGLQ